MGILAQRVGGGVNGGVSSTHQSGGNSSALSSGSAAGSHDGRSVTMGHAVMSAEELLAIREEEDDAMAQWNREEAWEEEEGEAIGPCWHEVVVRFTTNPVTGGWVGEGEVSSPVSFSNISFLISLLPSPSMSLHFILNHRT